MKEITITYFRADQLTLILNMTSTVPEDVLTHIYTGYSATMPDGDVDHAKIQIWNILESDVMNYGSYVDIYLMDKAKTIEGYNFINAVLEDDPGCIKCKLVNILSTVMNKALNNDDEITISWYGDMDPEQSCSSIPQIIYEVLDDMDKDDSPYEWEGMLRRRGSLNIVKIKKRVDCL